MGRKRRCVGTQLDATAVKNEVRMRVTQGTQEMASVPSGRGASASEVEYIFTDVCFNDAFFRSGSLSILLGFKARVSRLSGWVGTSLLGGVRSRHRKQHRSLIPIR